MLKEINEDDVDTENLFIWIYLGCSLSQLDAEFLQSLLQVLNL